MTMKGERRALRLTIVLFLLPTAVLLGLFVIWPISGAAQLSFVDWNGVDEVRRFVGLANWRLLLHDPVFWRALRNNLTIVVLSIVLQLPVAMALAVLLERGGRRLRLYKVVYFFPMLMSTVSVGILFKYVLDPQFGIVNAILRGVGLTALARNWLGDPQVAMLAVVGVVSWQWIPFYMLLFYAALTSLPAEVRESARLDGASETQYFFRIALPLMKGTVRTACVLSLIGSLKYFDLVWVMTEGGPSHASELMATYMYKKAFTAFNMGYGSTVATAMFLIVMAAGLGSLWLTRKIDESEQAG
jgi:raffinose/stachyose/melibiose transport system permease protein